jgi:hypothetical protein
MAKVRLHPLLEQRRGSIKGMVFRLSHNGKTSVYLEPDMSRVKWSPAQVAHREKFAAARAYARAAMADPELRTIYTLRSLELKTTTALTTWQWQITSRATTCLATSSNGMWNGGEKHRNIRSAGSGRQLSRYTMSE